MTFNKSLVFSAKCLLFSSIFWAVFSVALASESEPTTEGPLASNNNGTESSLACESTELPTETVISELIDAADAGEGSRSVGTGKSKPARGRSVQSRTKPKPRKAKKKASEEAEENNEEEEPEMPSPKKKVKNNNKIKEKSGKSKGDASKKKTAAMKKEPSTDPWVVGFPEPQDRQKEPAAPTKKKGKKSSGDQADPSEKSSGKKGKGTNSGDKKGRGAGKDLKGSGKKGKSADASGTSKKGKSAESKDSSKKDKSPSLMTGRMAAPVLPAPSAAPAPVSSKKAFKNINGKEMKIATKLTDTLADTNLPKSLVDELSRMIVASHAARGQSVQGFWNTSVTPSGSSWKSKESIEDLDTASVQLTQLNAVAKKVAIPKAEFDEWAQKIGASKSRAKRDTSGGPSFGDQSQGGPSFGDQSQGGPSFGDQSQGGPSFGDQSQGGPSFGDQSQTGPSFGDHSQPGPTNNGAHAPETFTDPVNQGSFAPSFSKAKEVKQADGGFFNTYTSAFQPPVHPPPPGPAPVPPGDAVIQQTRPGDNCFTDPELGFRVCKPKKKFAPETPPPIVEVSQFEIIQSTDLLSNLVFTITLDASVMTTIGLNIDNFPTFIIKEKIKNEQSIESAFYYTFATQTLRTEQDLAELTSGLWLAPKLTTFVYKLDEESKLSISRIIFVTDEVIYWQESTTTTTTTTTTTSWSWSTYSFSQQQGFLSYFASANMQPTTLATVMEGSTYYETVFGSGVQFSMKSWFENILVAQNAAVASGSLSLPILGDTLSTYQYGTAQLVTLSWNDQFSFSITITFPNNGGDSQVSVESSDSSSSSTSIDVTEVRSSSSQSKQQEVVKLNTVVPTFAGVPPDDLVPFLSPKGDITGNGGNTGDSGNSGNPSNPDGSGSPSNSDNPDSPTDTNRSGNPSNTGNAGNTGNTRLSSQLATVAYKIDNDDRITITQIILATPEVVCEYGSSTPISQQPTFLNYFASINTPPSTVATVQEDGNYFQNLFGLGVQFTSKNWFDFLQVSQKSSSASNQNLKPLPLVFETISYSSTETSQLITVTWNGVVAFKILITLPLNGDQPLAKVIETGSSQTAVSVLLKQIRLNSIRQQETVELNKIAPSFILTTSDTPAPTPETPESDTELETTNVKISTKKKTSSSSSSSETIIVTDDSGPKHTSPKLITLLYQRTEKGDKDITQVIYKTRPSTEDANGSNRNTLVIDGSSKCYQNIFGSGSFNYENWLSSFDSDECGSSAGQDGANKIQPTVVEDSEQSGSGLMWRIRINFHVSVSSQVNYITVINILFPINGGSPLTIATELTPNGSPRIGGTKEILQKEISDDDSEDSVTVTTIDKSFFSFVDGWNWRKYIPDFNTALNVKPTQFSFGKMFPKDGFGIITIITTIFNTGLGLATGIGGKLPIPGAAGILSTGSGLATGGLGALTGLSGTLTGGAGGSPLSAATGILSTGMGLATGLGGKLPIPGVGGVLSTGTGALKNGVGQVSGLGGNLPIQGVLSSGTGILENGMGALSGLGGKLPIPGVGGVLSTGTGALKNGLGQVSGLGGNLPIQGILSTGTGALKNGMGQVTGLGGNLPIQGVLSTATGSLKNGIGGLGGLQSTISESMGGGGGSPLNVATGLISSGLGLATGLGGKLPLGLKQGGGDETFTSTRIRKTGTGGQQSMGATTGILNTGSGLGGLVMGSGGGGSPLGGLFSTGQNLATGIGGNILNTGFGLLGSGTSLLSGGSDSSQSESQYLRGGGGSLSESGKKTKVVTITRKVHYVDRSMAGDDGSTDPDVESEATNNGTATSSPSPSPIEGEIIDNGTNPVTKEITLDLLAVANSSDISPPVNATR